MSQLLVVIPVYKFDSSLQIQQVEPPPVFDELPEAGQGIAGSPETVAAYLRKQIVESGANYLVGQFAFGDLSLEESLRSVDLFTQHVMPALKKKEDL